MQRTGLEPSSYGKPLVYISVWAYSGVRNLGAVLPGLDLGGKLDWCGPALPNQVWTSSGA
jgi:hypothetical protein